MPRNSTIKLKCDFEDNPSNNRRLKMFSLKKKKDRVDVKKIAAELRNQIESRKNVKKLHKVKFQKASFIPKSSPVLNAKENSPSMYLSMPDLEKMVELDETPNDLHSTSLKCSIPVEKIKFPINVSSTDATLILRKKLQDEFIKIIPTEAPPVELLQCREFSIYCQIVNSAQYKQSAVLEIQSQTEFQTEKCEPPKSYGPAKLNRRIKIRPELLNSEQESEPELNLCLTAEDFLLEQEEAVSNNSAIESDAAAIKVAFENASVDSEVKSNDISDLQISNVISISEEDFYFGIEKGAISSDIVIENDFTFVETSGIADCFGLIKSSDNNLESTVSLPIINIERCVIPETDRLVNNQINEKDNCELTLESPKKQIESKTNTQTIEKLHGELVLEKSNIADCFGLIKSCDNNLESTVSLPIINIERCVIPETDRLVNNQINEKDNCELTLESPKKQIESKTNTQIIEKLHGELVLEKSNVADCFGSIKSCDKTLKDSVSLPKIKLEPFLIAETNVIANNQINGLENPKEDLVSKTNNKINDKNHCELNIETPNVLDTLGEFLKENFPEIEKVPAVETIPRSEINQNKLFDAPKTIRAPIFDIPKTCLRVRDINELLANPNRIRKRPQCAKDSEIPNVNEGDQVIYPSKEIIHNLLENIVITDPRLNINSSNYFRDNQFLQISDQNQQQNQFCNNQQPKIPSKPPKRVYKKRQPAKAKKVPVPEKNATGVYQSSGINQIYVENISPPLNRNSATAIWDNQFPNYEQQPNQVYNNQMVEPSFNFTNEQNFNAQMQTHSAFINTPSPQLPSFSPNVQSATPLPSPSFYPSPMQMSPNVYGRQFQECRDMVTNPRPSTPQNNYPLYTPPGINAQQLHYSNQTNNWTQSQRASNFQPPPYEYAHNYVTNNPNSGLTGLNNMCHAFYS